MTDYRSYSIEAEATNAAGQEITVEVTVEHATDLPAAVAAMQAAVAALPAGYSAEGPDADGE
jgi:hypothetical protein